MIGYCTGCMTSAEDALMARKQLAKKMLKAMTAGGILDAMETISRRLQKRKDTND